jgi:hypothetical protein
VKAHLGGPKMATTKTILGDSLMYFLTQKIGQKQKNLETILMLAYFSMSKLMMF